MVKQYVGARYVPKFANPVEWAADTSYEALTIVTFNNASYTSKIPVPPTVGNPANNPQYWALTGNYNAQVEQYRQETENYNAQVELYKKEIENYITADKKVYICETVNEMINTNAKAGDIIICNHYHNNDNGFAIYNIESTNIDAFRSIKLENGIYANIILNDTVNVDQLGAEALNDEFDNSDIFNYACTNFKNVFALNHYYVKKPVTVFNNLMGSDYGWYYSYQTKEHCGTLYCDDTFEGYSIIIMGNNAHLENVSVNNISATSTHIYVPSMNGISSFFNNTSHYSGCSLNHVSAVGTNIGIITFGHTEAHGLCTSCCIVGAELISSDSIFTDLYINTNVHMAKNIDPELTETDSWHDGKLCGIRVLGGNNTFTGGKIEWTYYGICCYKPNNYFNQFIFDWNYDSFYIGRIKNGTTAINNCVFYSQEYHIYSVMNVGRLMVSNTGFFTSDGSAGPVLTGDNIKPTVPSLKLYPISSKIGDTLFTFTGCSLAHSSTAQYVFNYSPYATIMCTGCEIDNTKAVIDTMTDQYKTSNYAFS